MQYNHAHLPDAGSGSGEGIEMRRQRWSVGPIRVLVAAAALLLQLQPFALNADDPSAYGEYVIDVVELDNGDTVVGHIFPSPPPDKKSLPATAIVERTSAASVSLNGVPAFDWCYGCSATSAAMLFGYYDRHGFANMYDGPANSGVCPLTNAVWGDGESSLSATHMGLDGLAVRGHVDDYFDSPYNPDDPSTHDPYYGNWTEHGYDACTADFMGTSQNWNWGNVDGGTTFFYYTNNSPLHDYWGSESSGLRDGMHGMRLFAESRGYTVLANYNQYIYGYGGTAAGFTWTQYKAEIDAGRPVLIQVVGHTMLGVGYDDPHTVYVHDTWDYSLHAMTWGGSYAGMTHFAVGVFELEPSLSAPEARTDAASSVEGTTATLNGTVLDDGGEDCEYSFQYSPQAGGPYEDTVWSGSLESGESFSQELSLLDSGSTWFFRARARNSAGTGYGEELSFTTRPAAPSALAATLDEHTPYYRVDLSWTLGDGAAQTHVRAKQGAYPADPTDGVLVYEGEATAVVHSGLLPETTYYYRAWSIVEDASGHDIWSDESADALATTADEPPTVSFSLDLRPGWNMVSVPLYLPDMSIGSVFSGAVAVYAWDQSAKAYVVPQKLDPCCGYWVAVPAVTRMNYTGVPLKRWSVTLSPGWNLAGSVYGGQVDFSQPSDDPDGSVEAFAYSWNPLAKSYDYAQTIEPGRAHWLAVRQPCELTVECTD